MSYFTLDELRKIRSSLDASLRNCKTVGLYQSLQYSISLLDREIKLKTLNPVKSDERQSERQSSERSQEGYIRETEERKEANHNNGVDAKDTRV